MKELLTMSHGGQSLDLLWCYDKNDMLHRRYQFAVSATWTLWFSGIKTTLVFAN